MGSLPSLYGSPADDSAQLFERTNFFKIEGVLREKKIPCFKVLARKKVSRVSSVCVPLSDPGLVSELVSIRSITHIDVWRGLKYRAPVAHA